MNNDRHTINCIQKQALRLRKTLLKLKQWGNEKGHIIQHTETKVTQKTGSYMLLDVS